MDTKKISVREVIVVEGRDDTNAINKALDALTIETHGFGIKQETWEEMEKAYETQGLIVFTDPDFSGEEIRKRILKKFPNSKEAFLTKNEAICAGDIGIENASPKDIVKAIKNAHYTKNNNQETFSEEFLSEFKLVGEQNSKILREKVGKELGIGYSNGKTFLKKLNKYGIKRKELEETIKKCNEN